MPSHPSGTVAPSRRGLLSRFLAGLTTLAWGAHRGAALADAPTAYPRAPRRRPRANLKPPSLPFPPSRIVQPVRMVAASPRDFSLRAFERALRAGGVIRLGPGIYDLTGIRAQTLAGVRIEGAGKHVTVLRGAFDVDRDFSPRASDVVGVISGRVELENLTFDRVRAVLISRGKFGPGGSSGTSTIADGGALQQLAAHFDTYPRPFTDALACRNVAFTNSGRAVWIEEGGYPSRDLTNAISDCFWFNCDFVNMWHAMAVKCEGPTSNWLFYNCYFEDLIFRDPDNVHGYRHVGVGVRLGHNSADRDAVAAGSDNVRLEHCTFNGLSTVTQPRPVDDGEHLWVYPFRMVNAHRDCWVRYCRFQNIGWDRHGLRQCTMPETSGLLYPKGMMTVENVIVDRICLGDSGIFNNKGAIEIFLYDEGSTDVFTYRFRNVYISGVERIPATNRTDGRAGDFVPKNIFFTGHAVESRVENVTVADAETRTGLLGQFVQRSGVIGSMKINNVTVKNLTITQPVGALLRIGATSREPAPTVKVTNVLARIAGAEPEPLALLKVGRRARCGEIRLSDVRLELLEGGVEIATLLELDGVATVSAEPIGNITGRYEAAYAVRGAHIGAQPLARSGSVTGASTAWMTEGPTIGCDPVR